MNSFELAYQSSRISVNDGVMHPPPPPQSLSAGSSYSSAADRDFELDYFRFDAAMALSPSFASSATSSSSVGSTSSQESTGMNSQLGSTLTRSHGVHNLSALGGACYETSVAKRSIPSRQACRGDGWGYFVDTPSR